LRILLNHYDDFFQFQRIALFPTVEPLPVHELHIALKSFSVFDQKALLDMISKQGLQFFWLEALKSIPSLPFAAAGLSTLKERCYRCAALYLAQKRAILEVDNLFQASHLPYAVFKGAHIREVVYDNPVFRTAVDIDLLVHPEDKEKAVGVLCANGFTLHPRRTNITHEVSLSKDNIALDLHWHIMRPGRTRIELTSVLLQSRVRCGYFWALDNELTLLVLLTHSVFTKYSTGPQSSLVRLVDLRQWISKQKIDWPWLLCLLEEAGLKTAAWITATLLADLTGCCLPAWVYNAISPQQPKRFILEKWLRLNLSSALENYPFVPKYIFTLLAHERFSDVFRFVRTFRLNRLREDELLENLQQAAQRK
jgi:hypothetical protein